MNYIDIIECDLINAMDGVNVSLFVSGCNLNCPNCFNKLAMKYNAGNEFTDKTINLILEYLKPDHISGLSLLGGHPLDKKNINEVLNLCSVVRSVYGSTKNIICWTGYTFEEVQVNHSSGILEYIDVLIDGKFDENLKDLSLKLRGSSNQRILYKGVDFS